VSRGGDSISWQRFCRIPFGTRVPHPTHVDEDHTRCGDDAVAGLNEALLAMAATASCCAPDKVRADTTVVEAAVAIRPIRVCWPRQSARWRARWRGSKPPVVPRVRGADRRARRPSGHGRSPRSCGCAVSRTGSAQAAVRRITGELAGIAGQAMHDASR